MNIIYVQDSGIKAYSYFLTQYVEDGLQFPLAGQTFTVLGFDVKSNTITLEWSD